jgi:hypothetical protein
VHELDTRCQHPVVRQAAHAQDLPTPALAQAMPPGAGKNSCTAPRACGSQRCGAAPPKPHLGHRAKPGQRRSGWQNPTWFSPFGEDGFGIGDQSKVQ